MKVHANELTTIAENNHLTPVVIRTRWMVMAREADAETGPRPARQARAPRGRDALR
jgi:hypothetical protein